MTVHFHPEDRILLVRRMDFTYAPLFKNFYPKLKVLWYISKSTITFPTHLTLLTWKPLLFFVIFQK